jgi:GNAT superfamily N-acetyltransferase
VSELILVPLADNPAAGAEPLAWSLDLWGESNPWFSPGDWQTFYAKAAKTSYGQWNLDGVDQEQIYIAKLAGEIVGAIALVDFDDVEEFRHLKPWVAAFIVGPDFRGRGIGSEMLATLEERARNFSIRNLYLWTEDQRDYYLKRGYQLIEHRQYSEIAIDVMGKDL